MKPQPAVLAVGYDDGWQKMYLAKSERGATGAASNLKQLDALMPTLEKICPLVLMAAGFLDEANDWKEQLGGIAKVALPVLGTVYPPLGIAMGALGAASGASGGKIHFSKAKSAYALGMMTQRARSVGKARRAAEEEVARLTQEGEEYRSRETENRLSELEASLAAASEQAEPLGVLVMDPTSQGNELVDLTEVRDALWTPSYDLLDEAYDAANGGDPAYAFDVLRRDGGAEAVVEEASKCASGLSPRRAKNGTPCCKACARDSSWYGELPTGEFYRSNLVRASLVKTLGDGTYGMIDFGHDFPLPISISARHGPARAKISAAHELAHLVDQRNKFGLSHQQVHELGMFYAEEGVPMLNALQEVIEGGNYASV